MPIVADLARLVALALEAGATTALSFPAGAVLVDPRVRLKCQVPRCPHYGVNLMCPPGVMSAADFATTLARYRHAIIAQVAIKLPPASRSGIAADPQENPAASDSPTARGFKHEHALTESSRQLARIVHLVEAEALRLGYPLAAGFTAGHCRLCDECVTVASGQPCRLAFRARPAMEAVGIDVVRTATLAGLSVTLSDPDKAKWTGLVLID